MLILTRNISQKIFINDREIVITVLGVQGNQVRLGIDAPPDIKIFRSEIYGMEPKPKPEPQQLGATPTPQPQITVKRSRLLP